MSGPRAYTRSTIYALAALGEGTCYWPDPPCNVPVVVYVKGQPVTNLNIAHIRAAEPNGPRYVSGMSNPERSAWANLILLCTPHHNWVDKIRPGDYPIEKLEQWKSDREAGGLAKLKGLNELTEDRLQEMLAYSIREAYKEIRDLLAEQKTIDPDAAMLLSRAARHLNMDTAATLYRVSKTLAPALTENTDKLYLASRTLAGVLSQHGGQLYSSTKNLAGLIEQLDQRIRELRKLRG